MKKLLFGLLSILILASCGSKTNYFINGNIPSLTDGNLNLYEIKGADIDTIAIINVKDGIFTYEGYVEKVTEALLRHENGQFVSMFYLEDGTINIIAEEGAVEPVVTAGPVNEVNNNMLAMTRVYEEFVSQLRAKFMALQQEGDTLAIKELLEEYNSRSEANEKDIQNFIADNMNSPVAATLLLTNSYLYKDNLEEVFNNLGDDAKNSKPYDALASFVERVSKVKIGQPYVDFEIPSIEGENVKLSDYVGKGYLLLDFWASWCRPCRQENPYVVKVYEKYNSKGFDIFAVSLDQSEAEWKAAIEKDKLTWHHASHLKQWQCEAAKKYVVRGIPSNVLIDAEGLIIAKDLRGDQLEHTLDSLYSDR